MKRQLESNHGHAVHFQKVRTTSNLSLEGTLLRDLSIDTLSEISARIQNQDIFCLLSCGDKLFGTKFASAMKHFHAPAPLRYIPRAVLRFCNLSSLIISNFVVGTYYKHVCISDRLAATKDVKEISFPNLKVLSFEFVLCQKDLDFFASFLAKIDAPKVQEFTSKVGYVAEGRIWLPSHMTIEEQIQLYSSYCNFFCKLMSVKKLTLLIPPTSSADADGVAAYGNLLQHQALVNLESITVCLNFWNDDYAVDWKTILQPIPSSCTYLDITPMGQNPYISMSATAIAYLPRSVTKIRNSFRCFSALQDPLDQCILALPRSLQVLDLSTISTPLTPDCFLALPPSLYKLSIDGSQKTFHTMPIHGNSHLIIPHLRVKTPCKSFWQWLPQVVECSALTSLEINPSVKIKVETYLTSPDSPNPPFFAKLKRLIIRISKSTIVADSAPIEPEQYFVGIEPTDFEQYFASMPLLSDLTVLSVRHHVAGKYSNGAEFYRTLLMNAPKSLERLKIRVGFHMLRDNDFGLVQFTPIMVARDFFNLEQLHLSDLYSERCNYMDDSFVLCLPRQLRVLKMAKSGIMSICLSPKGWSGFPRTLQLFELNCFNVPFASSMAEGLRDALPSSCRIKFPPLLV